MNEDQERCMALAAPLLPTFHDCWQAAVSKFQDYPLDLVAEHDDTTVANIIRSHMLMQLRLLFTDHPHAAMIEVRGLKLLRFKDELVFRFKKVDESGRHRNYPTQQQQDFDDQLPLPEIPPAAVRLTCGYQPDASGGIERVIVARPFGRSTAWAAQVNVVDERSAWVDITPQRLPGTERFERREKKDGK